MKAEIEVRDPVNQISAPIESTIAALTDGRSTTTRMRIPKSAYAMPATFLSMRKPESTPPVLIRGGDAGIEGDGVGV